ncbi:uncharacterized protein EV154DRAFT_484450 [Mucor mucedo]|uniref:uncharacterized protein n=1 Tax=Mucor mucedo TaxID=29922 RepID=UPI002220E0B1|nr:uncharacterized protein EV154DRAFT_484450 [Mucor mucedo]KAI7888138.1 hypothetical protein EV154DRAFT_484450 [Mucor mucedo]
MKEDAGLIPVEDADRGLNVLSHFDTEIRSTSSRTERTFWIDLVVLIFQIFGDHSQLLGFQWCEVSTDEHMEFIMDPDTWMRTAGIKYHDGLGYDQESQSRLIMEGSSKSITREDIEAYPGRHNQKSPFFN